MVSNASEDFPDPLKPVITTSLSRGIESVRFLRLCSRAPPILMNSLAMTREFFVQTNRLLYRRTPRNQSICRDCQPGDQRQFKGKRNADFSRQNGTPTSVGRTER